MVVSQTEWADSNYSKCRKDWQTAANSQEGFICLIIKMLGLKRVWSVCSTISPVEEALWTTSVCRNEV